MNRLSNNAIIISSLGLACSRIMVFFFVTLFKINSGYFLDIFIVIYLFLWLYLSNRKNVYSLLYVITITALISLISIGLYELFILFYLNPTITTSFIRSRATGDLSVLLLSLISSVIYYITQHFFKEKTDHEKGAGWDFESDKNP